MDISRLKPPQEATRWLFDNGFIRLPPGSFFSWIESEWFDRFKVALSYKHGMWIPYLDKLTELDNILKAYRDYEFKKYGEELKTKQTATGI